MVWNDYISIDHFEDFCLITDKSNGGTYTIDLNNEIPKFRLMVGDYSELTFTVLDGKLIGIPGTRYHNLEISDVQYDKIIATRNSYDKKPQMKINEITNNKTGNLRNCCRVTGLS